MRDEVLPDAVQRLIADRIDSVPELEAILLLRRTRDRRWTPAQAGERLYVSATMAAHILGVLAERGFLRCDEEQFRYAPENEELDHLVDALAQAYSRALIAVTTAIHAKPSSSVRQFANAFVLRKGK
jgi:hypothetical protein